NKQSIDNETKAYFEAIRQRLKTVVGPKTAVLQHSIQEAKIAVASGYALPMQIQMQGPSAAATIDQIYFLRHYTETRDTVDLLKQRKLEVESGSAFVEASQISVDDFPNEVQYLQTLVDRDPEAQKELGFNNYYY
ncbi:MAG: hypothetical protein EZS28_046302, partial [Streblomastix strix]